MTDALARQWVVTHRVPGLDGFMWTLSAIGRAGFVFLIIALVMAVRRHRVADFILVVLAVTLAAAVTDQVVKPLVNRPRPFIVMAGAPVIGGRPNDASFPSGHASNAFAGAVALSNVAPSAAVIWWTLAVAIAYSRVYLGVHYPGDVMAGALVGIGCALIVIRVRSALHRTGVRKWGAH
jgi:undecaprenyl-diphosphatase